MTQPKTMKIDDVEYIRKDSIQEPKPNGNRALIVVDRGWIFCGDVTRENGRLKLARATWLFKWSSIGLDGVLKDWKNKNVDLRKIPDVDIPEGSEILSIPVSDTWGVL